MRTVVSVATGPHYVNNLCRLMDTEFMANTHLIMWADMLPPGSPTHAENPYAFKIYAIEEAVRRGATTIIWMDSSTVILRDLRPLWELIEKQGYWFSRNYGYNNAQFTSDEALGIMGITAGDAAFIPHVVASCFGLDMSSGTAREFMYRWKRLAEDGAFRGDRGDLSGTGEKPYYGHRNDQSCASQVCHQIGMSLTDPPDYFAEQGREQNERTILTLER